MSVFFETQMPNTLLNAFKKAIDDKHVVTWSYDSDGDFKHLPTQWANQGWLRPKIIAGERLRFNFLGRDETTLAAYGVLQGRMVESMVNHCPNLFVIGTVTAKATSDDSYRVRVA